MEYKLTFKQFNDFLKQDKLMALKCLDCGALTIPPKLVCRKCGSANLELQQLSGKGTIKTYSVINVAPEGREKEAPYIIAMVEMEEGAWVIGNLVDTDPAKASMELIGRRVSTSHAVFPGDKYSAGEAVRPVFKLE